MLIAASYHTEGSLTCGQDESTLDDQLYLLSHQLLFD